VRLEWSAGALADLDRCATFLQAERPFLSSIVARAIIEKVQALSQYPELGRPIEGNDQYRQVVLEVLKAKYVFQYRWDGERLVVLRVFHGRERR
jgi:plasmid stabilization system protein ParE